MKPSKKPTKFVRTYLLTLRGSTTTLHKGFFGKVDRNVQRCLRMEVGADTYTYAITGVKPLGGNRKRPSKYRCASCELTNPDGLTCKELLK